MDALNGDLVNFPIRVFGAKQYIINDQVVGEKLMIIGKVNIRFNYPKTVHKQNQNIGAVEPQNTK